MNIEQLKKELRTDEGLRLKPYKDTKGKLTIGVGRNLDDVGINEYEADLMLLNDISDVLRSLDMALPWWKDLSEVQQRALANMTFNMGLHKILEFREMLKALKAGDYAKAAEEALNSVWSQDVGARAQRIAVQLATG